MLSVADEKNLDNLFACATHIILYSQGTRKTRFYFRFASIKCCLQLLSHQRDAGLTQKFLKFDALLVESHHRAVAVARLFKSLTRFQPRRFLMLAGCQGAQSPFYLFQVCEKALTKRSKNLFL